LIAAELRARLIATLKQLGRLVCLKVREELRQSSTESLIQVATQTAGDTIYVLDHKVDEVILPFLEKELAPHTSFVLVAEGCAEDGRVFPAGTAPDEAELRLLIDPIDGTRGIMYDKRSAWFLAGIAPNLQQRTRLEDIEVAVQVEIPTTRSELADILWATRGEGASGVTLHLVDGTEQPFRPSPSGSPTVAGGFAMLTRFFPPDRDVMAAIDDELMRRILGDAEGRALVFEDQFPSTGAQLYDLAVGKTRFVADIRPLIYARREGRQRGISCHPYDLATALVARESGVVVRGLPDEELNFPIDTTTPVAWAAYANDRVRAEVEPHLLAILEERGFLDPPTRQG
jgi:hypothetical protein